MGKVQTHEFNQSNLRFVVKNTLLNNSHLERFNTVRTPFPMERHKYVYPVRTVRQTNVVLEFPRILDVQMTLGKRPFDVPCPLVMSIQKQHTFIIIYRSYKTCTVIRL